MTLCNNVQDLDVTRGDTVAFNVELWGMNGEELGDAVVSVKQKIDDTEYVFQYDMSSGVIESVDYDAQTDIRTYAIKIPADATADLDLGIYYYDLQITFNETIVTILKGKFIVTFDVTRNNV